MQRRDLCRAQHAAPHLGMIAPLQKTLIPSEARNPSCSVLSSVVNAFLSRAIHSPLLTNLIRETYPDLVRQAQGIFHARPNRRPM
jgi:hypothetical protein